MLDDFIKDYGFFIVMFGMLVIYTFFASLFVLWIEKERVKIEEIEKMSKYVFPKSYKLKEVHEIKVKIDAKVRMMHIDFKI
jgi:hypothetical protein